MPRGLYIKKAISPFPKKKKGYGWVCIIVYLQNGETDNNVSLRRDVYFICSM